MSPRLGLAGHAFSNYRPEELLDIVDRIGLSALDYWPWNSGELRVGEFRDLADAKGVRIYCVNVPGAVARLADPHAGDEAHGAIVAAMDDAQVLGADMVQVYSAVPRADGVEESARALAAAVRPLVAEAAHRNLVVTLENNLDQRGEDARRLNPSRLPEAMAAALESVGCEHFRACYDPCNFVTVGVEEYPLAYDLLRPHVANVHVKDCRRYVPALHAGMPEAAKLLIDSHEGAFIPTALGEGAVSWQELIDCLVRDRYSAWITLDPFIADNLLEGWCTDAARRLTELLARPARPAP
jgi:sugar phosphate isomerase/epimerase